ncbi:MAG: hypothetical protein ACXAC2_16665 [Candidatus Kariarchaeaceae archaeon]|jgi:hypothetical protein
MSVGDHKHSINILLNAEIQEVDECIDRHNKEFNDPDNTDKEYSSWELKRYTRQRAKLQEALDAMELAFDFGYCVDEKINN